MAEFQVSELAASCAGGEGGEPVPVESYSENMQSAADNYRYIAAKYGTPITQLVVDNHFFLINDIIRDKHLPDCAEYLSTRKVADHG